MINMEYLMDFDNIIEQTMFFLNCYYNYTRMHYPEFYLARVEQLTDRKDLEDEGRRIASR